MQLDIRRMKNGMLKCQFIHKGEIHLATLRTNKLTGTRDVYIYKTEKYTVPRKKDCMVYEQCNYVYHEVPFFVTLVYVICKYAEIDLRVNWWEIDHGVTHVEWDDKIIPVKTGGDSYECQTP